MKKYLIFAALVALAVGIVGVSPEPANAAKNKVPYCHFDNSSDDLGHVILISANGSSVGKHIAHGDYFLNLAQGTPCAAS